MKVLVYGINYSPELTGIGKYSGEMTEWLLPRGHEVRVITAPPYYPQWRVMAGYSSWRVQFERLNGVDVWRCPLWVPNKPSGFKRILHLASFALLSLPVMLFQVRWRPDVVLVVEPPLFCAPVAAMVARLSGGRSWLHVQDFEVDAAFDLGLLKSRWLRRMVLVIEQWLMCRFDRVSTISGRMMLRLGAKGVPESRRVLFPNWVDTAQIHPMDQVSPLRVELGFGDQDVVALYSGNMGQKQGLELVIEAARSLIAENSIRFVMCGQGAAYDRLRVMGEGLPNITWIPLQPIERLNDLLNLADIHLLPQSADAADLVMPSKLTGILASGRPVVATAAEGTEVWSVVEGRGVNTRPGDVNAFVNGILSLARDPELRGRLGRNGRLYAEEHLSRDKVLERFEAELLNLVRK